MNLKAIATYLQSKRLGTLTQDIFVTEMPTACEKGILLMSPYHGTPIDPYLPGLRETGFRLVSRSRDYDIAEALANKSLAVLTIQAELALKGILVKLCRPVIEPKPYRRSAGAYWEFEIEFEITYVLTP